MAAMARETTSNGGGSNIRGEGAIATAIQFMQTTSCLNESLPVWRAKCIPRLQEILGTRCGSLSGCDGPPRWAARLEELSRQQSKDAVFACGLTPAHVEQLTFFCGEQSVVPGDCLWKLQRAQDELACAERVFHACVDAENEAAYATYKSAYDAHCKAYATCTNPYGCSLPPVPKY